jgi:hypothetical protein
VNVFLESHACDRAFRDLIMAGITSRRSIQVFIEGQTDLNGPGCGF